MNGKDLLEAMSFVDEGLLEDSQRPLIRKFPRYWAGMAACLCLILLGSFAYQRLTPVKGGGTTEAASQQAAPMAPAGDPVCDCAPAMEETVAQNRGDILVVQALILEVTREGFLVQILEPTGPFAPDEILNIRMDSDLLLEAGEVYLLEITEYDPETNIARVCFAEKAE